MPTHIFSAAGGIVNPGARASDRERIFSTSGRHLERGTYRGLLGNTGVLGDEAVLRHECLNVQPLAGDGGVSRNVSLDGDREPANIVPRIRRISREVKTARLRVRVRDG